MSSIKVTYRGLNDASTSGDSRIAYSPPVDPNKFGTYAAYLLVLAFIFMSLFLM